MARPEHRRRHGAGKQRRLVMTIVLAAVYVCVLAVILLMMRQERGATSETRGSLEGRFDPSVSYTWHDQRYGYRDNELHTILLIGVDNEELNSERTLYRSSTQADFMVLLVADKQQKKLIPIQIDRDTITDIDIYGVLGGYAGTRKTQLCLAQAFGKSVEDGSRNTAAAVSRYLLGIPIDDFFVFDMAFINRFNDMIGGVTVTLEDDFSAYDPAMTPGTTLRLQGSQAELFVRSRRTIADGTNSSRMKRQRVYMNAAANELRKHLTESEYVSSLLDGIEGNYATSMTRAAVINFAHRYSTYSMADMQQLPGSHTKGQDGFTEFHPDTEGVTELVLSTCFRKW